MSFFTQKDLSASQKNEFLYDKMTNAKKGTKKSTQPPKNLKFFMKYRKSSYLFGFWENKFSTPNLTKVLNP